MRRRGDWLQVHCGDRVSDGKKRQGRIDAIRHGATVVIRWDDGGTTELPLTEVLRARKAQIALDRLLKQGRMMTRFNGSKVL